MTAGFEPGPVNPEPLTLFTNSTPNDPTAILDGNPATKMTALRQRALDLHAQIPMFETVQEAKNIKVGHENRIANLMRHRSDGGFGLVENAPQVVDETRKLERADAEFARLSALKEIRTARWNPVAQLERSVTDWLLRGGIPGGCVIEPVEDAPLSELLTKSEGGRIDAAVERYRHRLKELAADLHRVKSAPWPSSVAKAAAKIQINALADAAAPDCERAIEHGLPIGFVQTSLSSFVRGTDKPALAHTETVDAFGFFCWLMRDQVVARISQQIDSVADDKAAMSQQQRDLAEAEIRNSMLMIERSECALIWIADSRGEIIDFRSTTSPQAVLGVRLVSQARAVAPGSTGEHAFDVVYNRR